LQQQMTYTMRLGVTQTRERERERERESVSERVSFVCEHIGIAYPYS